MCNVRNFAVDLRSTQVISLLEWTLDPIHPRDRWIEAPFETGDCVLLFNKTKKIIVGVSYPVMYDFKRAELISKRSNSKSVQYYDDAKVNSLPPSFQCGAYINVAQLRILWSPIPPDSIDNTICYQGNFYYKRSLVEFCVPRLISKAKSVRWPPDIFVFNDVHKTEEEYGLQFHFGGQKPVDLVNSLSDL